MIHLIRCIRGFTVSLIQAVPRELIPFLSLLDEFVHFPCACLEYSSRCIGLNINCLSLLIAGCYNYPGVISSLFSSITSNNLITHSWSYLILLSSRLNIPCDEHKVKPTVSFPLMSALLQFRLTVALECFCRLWNSSFFHFNSSSLIIEGNQLAGTPRCWQVIAGFLCCDNAYQSFRHLGNPGMCSTSAADH